MAGEKETHSKDRSRAPGIKKDYEKGLDTVSRQHSRKPKLDKRPGHVSAAYVTNIGETLHDGYDSEKKRGSEEKW